jgi:hypothetical protein
MEEDLYEWRKIPGFGYRYEVSEKGEVRSWLTKGTGKMPAEEPHMMKTKNRFGQPSVVLRGEDGKTHCRTISGLMRDAGFIEEESHLQKIMRPVVKIDKQGNVVGKYPSVKETARAHSCFDGTILYYLKGRNKRLFDLEYTFRYADEYYAEEWKPNGDAKDG